MKTDMRKKPSAEVILSEFREKNSQQLNERNSRADRLIEEWSQVPEIGKGLQESFSKNPTMIRNTAIVLENTANELSKLNETQISSAFKTTPENALRIVRLGYPNSNRGVVFHEFAMETARDSLYYLNPVYSVSKRGATAGQVTHENIYDRYPTERNIEAVTGAINDINKVYTGASAGKLATTPVRPFFFQVVVNGAVVAQDDGAGIVVGSVLDSGATNTITYSDGAVTVTFTDAPASGTTIQFMYLYDSEVEANYDELGEIELQLRRVQFLLREYRLGLSWTKHTELLLGTTLGIDAEEALIRGASEELKKALDYEAFLLGYMTAKGNSGMRTFDADYLSAGADSAKAHAQSLGRIFDDTADDIKNDLNRGGISAIYAGSAAANYISNLSDRFTFDGAEKEIGIHRVGTFMNKPFLKAPKLVIPTNEVVTVWNNEEAGDYAIAFGTLLPMYQSMKLEFKQGNIETALVEFGDHRVLNSKYVRRIALSNLDRY